jgi:hypothetical protein
LLIWASRPDAFFDAYFAVTAEGLLSLLVISLLFLLISIYTTGYLNAAAIRSERIFSGSMLLFLSTMTMVTLSDHIMVMWIAIEATTLASAPLIYTHRTAATLEATWKYVLICSVGIALALLGSVLITLAMDIGGAENWIRSGSRPVSCSSWWDTAPKWAWRRCTPGCRMRTAKPRPRHRHFCPECCSTAPIWGSSRPTKSCMPPDWVIFPA